MPVIAIDGPVASGKGTLARRLAEALNLAYLDTGSLYRAVASCILERGSDPDDSILAAKVADTLTAEDLDRDDIRDEIVGQGASIVAANQEVRKALLEFQRNFAKTPPDGHLGAILDGRDIGTVVCPDAEIKLFISATPEVRALRRHKELLERGEESIYARVLEDLRERDQRDRNRDTAPLRAAEDAVILDTSDMDADKAFKVARQLIKERLSL
ncbi:(d)CMP kinase [Kiloniella laminariae]|uniref:Cytidylate kinase n=1 Tax=Kiloniella laminariae TaxID=454162 RepID=A0ABT4LJV9_9PROT|nr:(d)CMP kinase [Kiloniella laminariae]MCZ4281395.1 (d)CMP kinase [Kiloniella laminariae]